MLWKILVIERSIRFSSHKIFWHDHTQLRPSQHMRDLNSLLDLGILSFVYALIVSYPLIYRSQYEYHDSIAFSYSTVP